MVSKARLDLPEPERPVMTTSWSRGISTSMFFRLCSRAPRTTILSVIHHSQCYEVLLYTNVVARARRLAGEFHPLVSSFFGLRNSLGFILNMEAVVAQTVLGTKNEIHRG